MTLPMPSVSDPALLASLRAAAREMPVSGIVEMMKYGQGRENMIPLWAGEGDVVTPDFIREEAVRSLREGETFYTQQRGIPELREALARYHARLYGGAFDPERFYVTASGMHAIVVAFAMVLNAGEEIVIPTPCWPNAGAAADAAGTRPVFLPMEFGAAGFKLDVAKLASCITSRTRAIFINSPANPTGWVAHRDELKEVLALARKHGLWIVADETYGRFHWREAGLAPSFHDIMQPDDRIIFVNTFSKNWAMTGWRIGWIEADPSLGQVIENLIQASTSGVAVFLQRAGVVALDQGEEFVAAQIERSRRGRDIVSTALRSTGRVIESPPDGAFYSFFSVKGETDSRALAFRMIDEIGVGPAPGTAFGPGGEAFVRLCFARSADSLSEAAMRIANWLKR
jgi:aspartate/methionine/tyrosine aminotransferase